MSHLLGAGGIAPSGQNSTFLCQGTSKLSLLCLKKRSNRATDCWKRAFCARRCVCWDPCLQAEPVQGTGAETGPPPTPGHHPVLPVESLLRPRATVPGVALGGNWNDLGANA